jgi:hypothetical protein
VTAGSGHIKIHQNLPAVSYWAKALGKSLCDMPMFASIILQFATVSKVEAESWQNPPNLFNQFLH